MDGSAALTALISLNGFHQAFLETFLETFLVDFFAVKLQ